MEPYLISQLKLSFSFHLASLSMFSFTLSPPTPHIHQCSCLLRAVLANLHTFKYILNRIIHRESKKHDSKLLSISLVCIPRSALVIFLEVDHYLATSKLFFFSAGSCQFNLAHKL